MNTILSLLLTPAPPYMVGTHKYDTISEAIKRCLQGGEIPSAEYPLPRIPTANDILAILDASASPQVYHRFITDLRSPVIALLMSATPLTEQHETRHGNLRDLVGAVWNKFLAALPNGTSSTFVADLPVYKTFVSWMVHVACVQGLSRETVTDTDEFMIQVLVACEQSTIQDLYIKAMHRRATTEGNTDVRYTASRNGHWVNTENEGVARVAMFRALCMAVMCVLEYNDITPFLLPSIQETLPNVVGNIVYPNCSLTSAMLGSIDHIIFY